MGIFRNLTRRFNRPETRAHDPSWDHLSGLNTGTGAMVNAHMAENLAAVLAAVNVVASSTASLPAFVFRRTDRGREVDTAHPLSRLIKQGPNRHQTWADFIEWLIASVLLRGNSLAEVVRDSRGRVMALRPIPWEWVSVSLLPSGRLAYDVTATTAIYGSQGRMRRLLEGEVFHLRDRSDDGLVGKSRLQRAAPVIRAGLDIQDHSSAMFANGVYPSGAIQADGQLSSENRTDIRNSFTAAFQGPRNAARALILDQGIKWAPFISMSPEDAELLASRKFSVVEISRLYQVPPPLIQDYEHNTFTNAETAGRWFSQFTIGPWVKKIESEFIRSVFSEAARRTHELEIDLSGFMRGDPATRWQGHAIAVQNQILTPNEIRTVEGWNPRPGGDGFGAGGQANG